MPQVFLAAAVKPNLAALQGALQRTWIHIAQHQYLAGFVVLGNSWQQAPFVKLDVHMMSPRISSRVMVEGC